MKKLFLLVCLTVVIFTAACSPKTAPEAETTPAPKADMSTLKHFEGYLDLPTMDYSNNNRVLNSESLQEVYHALYVEEWDFNVWNDTLVEMVNRKTIIKNIVTIEIQIEDVEITMLFTTDKEGHLIFVPCSAWPKDYDPSECTNFPSEDLRKLHVQIVKEQVPFAMVYMEIDRVDPNLSSLTTPLKYHGVIYRTQEYLRYQEEND